MIFAFFLVFISQSPLLIVSKKLSPVFCIPIMRSATNTYKWFWRFWKPFCNKFLFVNFRKAHLNQTQTKATQRRAKSFESIATKARTSKHTNTRHRLNSDDKKQQIMDILFALWLSLSSKASRYMQQKKKGKGCPGGALEICYDFGLSSKP